MNIQTDSKQVLSDKVLELIRNSRKCKARLQYVLEIAPATLQRYLDDNNIILTTATALSVIRKEIEIQEHEILVDETPNA